MITTALSKHLSEIGLSHEAALKIMTKHAERMEDFNTMRVGEVKMSEKTILVFRTPNVMTLEVVERVKAELEEHFGKGKCMLLWGVDLIGAIEKEAVS